jgi:hypothetical protein
MTPLRLIATASSLMLMALTPVAWPQQAPPPPQIPSSSSQPAAPARPQPAQVPPAAAPATASASAEPNSIAANPTANANATSNAKSAASAKIVLPTGTHIPLVLHNAISTRSAQRGDPVYFETTFPVMLNGKIVVPAGSWVSGELTEVQRPGRVKGRAELMMRLNTLILPNAYVVSLIGSPSNAGTGGNETTDREGKVKGDTDKGSDVGTVMTTTAEGAGIGAIAGQSAKGAGIGAAVGAAAGLAAVLLTRGPEAELPRGTTLDAVLDHPLAFDADKVQFTNPGQASALAGPPNREPVRTKFPF